MVKPARKEFASQSPNENIVLSPAEHRIEIPTKNLQRRMCQYCNISKTNYTNTERFFTEEWSAMYPKLAAAVEYIMTRKHRILVLVHPNCGFQSRARDHEPTRRSRRWNHSRRR